jgi:hypothetical protein
MAAYFADDYLMLSGVLWQSALIADGVLSRLSQIFL